MTETNNLELLIARAKGARTRRDFDTAIQLLTLVLKEAPGNEEALRLHQFALSGQKALSRGGPRSSGRLARDTLPPTQMGVLKRGPSKRTRSIKTYTPTDGQEDD